MAQESAAASAAELSSTLAAESADGVSRSIYVRQLEEGDSGAVATTETRSGGEDPPGESVALVDSEVYALFNLRPEAGKRRPPLLVDLALDGRPVKMEVDTGAAVSVCSAAGFRRLWPDHGPDLLPCSVHLKTYSEEALSVLGQVLVDVDYAGRVVRLPLVVVDGAGPLLLGRNWLDHIRLDWPAICRVQEQARVDGILEEFPEVFQDGLGYKVLQRREPEQLAILFVANSAIPARDNPGKLTSSIFPVRGWKRASGGSAIALQLC
ncbi:hypothetical protein FJT64_001610 [Amphibalanus amphitrite]|uniref:Peptidase A2 domain-containing protein n=1 Tax=Amphibalanus amphitrite TaxID=1232801 RepID=A0A6A4X2N8_AMPAM|nr:hypothetical protein FJT64_001610 [Amphibalanus amphitrite]